eukprot:4159331-Amphidinium_carterae.1
MLQKSSVLELLLCGSQVAAMKVSTNAAQSHQEAATKIIDGEQQRRMRRKSATSESFWDAQMMSPKYLGHPEDITRLS